MPQDGLYTVLEQSAAGDRAQVIGGLREILVAPEDPAAVIDRLAAPATRIVSLTVTEKGYGGDPATGRLDTATPAIAADLDVLARPAKAESTALPRTALGLMTAGLARRRAAGAPAPAMMSCDNLPANGETFARLLTAFAREIDPGLADWLAETAAFPSTMVDRIVPATTDAPARQDGRHPGAGGRLAGGDRAVQPVGGRGPLPARAAGMGRWSAPGWSTTWRRGRR